MTKKKTYEKPVLIYLTDNKTSKGLCYSEGSGDSDVCEFDGNYAEGNCHNNGSFAHNECNVNGADATSVCAGGAGFH